MTHGVSGYMHGIPSSAATIAGSVVIFSLTVEATDDSKSAAAYVFKGVGAHGVANRIASVSAGTGVKINTEYLGRDGVLCQDGFQCVTIANVSWAGVQLRYSTG